jgi:type IV pilus assembly protein PilC
VATFVFRAIDLAGVPSRGEVEAENKLAVTEQLKARGLIVLDISDKSGSKEISLPFGNKVKTYDLTVMTRQLATMVSSGMTLLRTLYVLEDQIESKPLREVVSAVRKDVESGVSFSDSLAKHPKVFGPLYVSMVGAGETGGVLEESLIRIANQLEADESLKRKVKSAMMYPLVVMAFAGLTLLGLVAFIVPVFVGIFKEFGGDLPTITKFTVAISNIVTHQWYLLIAAAFGIVTAFRKWKETDWGRLQWDAFRLRIPFKIGVVMQKVAIARWSRTFSALVAAGVPILQAIEITGKTAGNVIIENSMDAVRDSVKSGGTIAEPLKAAPVFPTMVAHMVGVGEETGALDTMLDKVADFYEDEVDAAVKALTSILEPVMIVVVGAIVGFIVIAMYMPLFKVYDQIR